MQFFRLIKHIFISLWKNASPLQAAIITAVIVCILALLIISLVQAIVPFTYIAI